MTRVPKLSVFHTQFTVVDVVGMLTLCAAMAEWIHSLSQHLQQSSCFKL